MAEGIVTDESGLSTGFTYNLPEIIGEDEGIILPGPYVFSGGRESLGGVDVTGSGLTLACRVRVDAASHTDARMISKASGVQEADHWWMLSTHQDTRLRFRLKTNGITTTLFSSLNTIVRGQWVHVAATYDGQKMRLYRDGNLVTETAKTGVIDSGPTVNVALGNQPVGAGDAPLYGVMEDVRILYRALSAAEISDLAGVVSDPIPDPEPEPESGETATITQHGITWTLSQSSYVGAFANGDPWVVGPVVITAISPSGNGVHGSMINPGIGSAQGFDSRMEYNSYFDALNIETKLPFTVQPNSSIVSTISHPTAGNRPQLTDAAVLTVLDQPPPDGALRPPYVGTDKTILGTVDDLDYNILHNLPLPANMVSVDAAIASISRPWIEINTSWTGRNMHPINNQPMYGREIAYTLGKALLLLHLDIDPEKKKALYIHLVQYGIDVYGAARLRAKWEDLGGHNPGRKMPMLLAGKALNNPDIMSYADAQKHFIFQEDRQTWFVTQYDVGRPLYQDDGRQREEYIQADVGIPEWGAQHTRNETRDDRKWSASYRWIASAWIGHALAAHLTGTVNDWNWPAFFSYTDRYYAIEGPKAKNFTNSIYLFERDMWELYK